jgi:hypothetical protein
MSIESKIAEILAESKAADLETQVMAEDVVAEEELKPAPKQDEPNNKKNAVVDEKPAEGGTSQKPNEVRKNAVAPEAKKGLKEDEDVSEEEVIAEEDSVDTNEELKAKMKEDIDAMLSGEELSEEFKTKAATIFEAAVMARVKQEVARVEKEFEARLEEESAKNAEGLVEQVDGYLGYVAEQWMVNNELALESGMKAEILEGFVGGLKGLFEEHYIDIPEERFDVLGSMEDHISELEEKLDEQMAANVEMAKYISESQRKEIIGTAAEGLSDAEAEKFHGLAEELSFEDAESFEAKVQTIRENYFSKKAEKSEAIVESVVTDAPVEELNESVEKKVQLDPRMAAFVAALNKK